MSELLVIDLTKFVKSFKKSDLETVAERLNEFALDHVMCQFNASLTFGESPKMEKLNETAVSKAISTYLDLTDEARDEVELFLRRLYQFTHDGKTMCPGALEHWSEAGIELIEGKVDRENFIEKLSNADHKRFLRKLGKSGESKDMFDNFDFSPFDDIVSEAIRIEFENLKESNLSKKKIAKLLTYLQDDNRHEYVHAMESNNIQVNGFTVFFGIIMPNVARIVDRLGGSPDTIKGAEDVKKLISSKKGREERKFTPDSDIEKLMRRQHSGPSTREDLDELDREYLLNNIHYVEPVSLENYATKLVTEIMAGKLDPAEAEEKFNKFIENNLPKYVGKISLRFEPHAISVGFRKDLNPKEATAAIRAARKLLRLN